MSDDATKPPAEPRKTTNMFATEAMERARHEEAERDERQADKALSAVDAANARALAAVERQATMWFRLALALIVVLLVLVAGVVGVGVTGKVPGFGNITIAQPSPPGVAPQRPEDDSPPAPEVP